VNPLAFTLYDPPFLAETETDAGLVSVDFEGCSLIWSSERSY
jgi:hypothetical protein